MIPPPIALHRRYPAPDAPGQEFRLELIPGLLSGRKIVSTEKGETTVKHEATTATHRSKAARGSDIAAANMLLRALRLRRIFLKANFDPNQPRKPRGTREGGQWTRPGGPAEPPAKLPAPARSARGRSGNPQGRPPIPRELLRQARDAAFDLAEAGRFLNRRALLAHAVEIGASELYPYIAAYLDPPKTLEELQRAALSPKPGYDVHHIVEKASAEHDGFPAALIEAAENRVLVSRFRHWQITAWYMIKNDEYGMMSPRRYLQGKSWRSAALWVYTLSGAMGL